MPGSHADRVEWALGFAAAAVVAGLVGYLVYEGLAGSRTLPVLVVETLPAAPNDPRGQVRFVVRNDGGQTATAVGLSLELRDGSGAVAGTRRLTLDYLPGHSEATGGFVLPEGMDWTAEIVVDGYLDP